MKPHLQCAEQHVSRSSLTKYCACHAERLTFLIIITYETSLQCTEQQASPSNISKYCACHTKFHSQDFLRKSVKTLETLFPMQGRSENDPTSPQPASQPRLFFRAHREHFLLKNTTFRAQSYIQTFTKCCTCHEK